MSPFRKITQQLNDLELKSPELEDFSTPVIAPPDLWPRAKTPTTNSSYKLMRSNSLTQLKHSPSLTLDIDAIHNLQHTVRAYNEQLQRKAKQATNQNKQLQSQQDEDDEEATFQSLPVNLNSNMDYQQFDEQDEDQFQTSSIQLIDLDEQHHTSHNTKPIKPSSTRPINTPQRNSTSTYDIDYETTKCSVFSTHNARFLDTKMMSTSPSANYYRPTEEPEPLDLTQLNIEASVMCLVSKIKFLCGRCGSPAIRLRHPKVPMKRSGFSNNPVPDVIDNGNTPSHMGIMDTKDFAVVRDSSPNGNSNGLNLDLTQPIVGIENQAAKKGNKFTDGK